MRNPARCHHLPAERAESGDILTHIHPAALAEGSITPGIRPAALSPLRERAGSVSRPRLPAVRGQTACGSSSPLRRCNRDPTRHLYKEHFRNQLKARLLKHTIATQVTRVAPLLELVPPIR